MTNKTAILSTMLNTYEEMSATGNYIFGFTDRKNVWVCFATDKVLPFVTKLDRASNKKDGFSVRFTPNKQQKELLKAQGRAFILCSEEYFEQTSKDSIYNRGDVFECMVANYFGQNWEKNNTPFTEDGDLTIDGIAYQLKYQKATFCTEASLLNLRNKIQK